MRVSVYDILVCGRLFTAAIETMNIFSYDLNVDATHLSTSNKRTKLIHFVWKVQQYFVHFLFTIDLAITITDDQ